MTRCVRTPLASRGPGEGLCRPLAFLAKRLCAGREVASVGVTARARHSHFPVLQDMAAGTGTRSPLTLQPPKSGWTQHRGSPAPDPSSLSEKEHSRSPEGARVREGGGLSQGPFQGRRPAWRSDGPHSTGCAAWCRLPRGAPTRGPPAGRGLLASGLLGAVVRTAPSGREALRQMSPRAENTGVRSVARQTGAVTSGP